MNVMTPINRKYRFRTIWISDVHLGTRDCKAAFLLDFLRHTESDYLYLVGDIIDYWRLKRTWHWEQAHNDVIQKLLRKARKGTKVYFIPGNHDETFRSLTPSRFGLVTVLDETIHTTADKKRLLVLHGDRFDAVVLHAKWLALLGDRAYSLALRINHYVNLVRRKLGFSYWSMSRFLKHKVKNAVGFIGKFERAVVGEAKRRNLDGVVCGHIHTPAITRYGDVLYCNDGDWVESCSALVEYCDGRLELIHWMELRNLSPMDAARQAERPMPATTRSS